jgi:enamine deaminase RidA (YjgF/YER057c/UK114 family)
MQQVIFDWLDHEWVWMRAEGGPDLDAAKQARGVLRFMESELSALDLSLANTVRTRLWARDRAARDNGSRVRADLLTGAARSVSSSFIAAGCFDSQAAVAIELWAMRGESGAIEKQLIEYEPPIVPLRYLVAESVLALSGVTSVLSTLDQQVAEILSNIEASLRDAGAAWGNAVKVSSTLQHGQSLAKLRRLLKPVRDQSNAAIEFDFADGYSTPGKLIEIEVTARLP